MWLHRSPSEKRRSSYFLARRLLIAAPVSPVPSSSMLAGSGTAVEGVEVICPCTVVMPLFDAGGTRFNGLLVMLYTELPIVIDVVVKFTTPEPELLAEKSPVNVDENELLPAIGTV